MLYDPNYAERQKRRERARIYEAAADVIQKRGHAKHVLQDEKGRVCLFGAINVVINGHAGIYTSYTQDMVITEDLRQFTHGWRPVTWNNAPERTQRQVVSMLRRAAKALAD